MIPPDLRYSLHVTLVALGRDVCHSKRPDCRNCPLLEVCPTGSTFLGSTRPMESYLAN
jgi:endonuclease III